MSSLLEFTSQTKSTLSSLATLQQEHETAMRNLDREISDQDLDSQDEDSVYRIQVCAEKRSLLEQNRNQIVSSMTQAEIILLAMTRITQLEAGKGELEDQMKLVVTEAQNLREQLDEAREKLEQSQERVVELEEEHEHVKFLASLSARAESALSGGLEGAEVFQGTPGAGGGRGEEGGEDRSAHMHMDDSTESSAAESTVLGSEGGLPVPEVSEATKRQMAIIIDYGKKGSYDIAVNLSKKTLEEQTGSSAQARSDRAVLLNTLALLYRDMEKPGESIPLLEEALSIREELLGSGHMGVAAMANNLAIFYSKTRQYKRAEDSCEKALRVKEKALGADSVEVAKQLSNLALICVSRKKCEEAEFHFTRARDIYETALGLKDRSVLKTMTELGQCYAQQGKAEEAETLFQQVLSRGEELQREAQGHGDSAAWQGALPIVVQCGRSLKDLYLSRRQTDQIKRVEAILQRLTKETKRSSSSYIPRISTATAATRRSTLPAPPPPRNSPTPTSALPSPIRPDSRGAPGGSAGKLLRGLRRGEEGTGPSKTESSSK